MEDLRPFVVKISRCSKYAPLLKISIACTETPDWRIFLLKDRASAEEATKMGAEMYKGVTSNSNPNAYKIKFE